MIVEGQEFSQIFFDRLPGPVQTLQEGLGFFAEGDKTGDLHGQPFLGSAFPSRFAVGREFDPLFFLPTAGMGGQDLFPEIDGDGLGIGLDDDRFADGPGRNRVAVAVETNGKVGMDLDREGFPAVG